MPNIDPVTGWFYRDGTEVTSEVHWTDRYYNVYKPKIRSHTFRDTKDQYITWSGNGRRAFHACYHRVSERWNVGGHASVVITADNTGEEVNSGWSNWLYGGSLPRETAADTGCRFDGIQGDWPTPDLPNLDWGQARDRILSDVMGRMPLDVSIPLNVLEFGQLKRLVPSMAKSVSSLLTLAKGPLGKERIYRHKYKDHVTFSSLRWGMKDLSSTYLAQTFGVLPLADDVSNWMTKYYQVKLHNDWFRKVADGKPHRFVASAPTVTASSESPGYVRFRSGGSYRFGDFDVPCKLTTTLEKRGVLSLVATSRPKTALAQVSATIASILGLNAPLSTAWEVIPFSFIADWILPIGEAVRRADNSLFGGVASLAASYSVDKFSYSTKVIETKSWELQKFERILRSYGWTFVLSLDKALSRTTTSTYSRGEGWPPINILPTSKGGWSIGRSLTSAALVLQRVFR